jgi:AcrR family transcriptional regulator
MGVKRPLTKAEQSAATRRVLLQVARKLFTERGYAETTTQDLARRAGMTKGALYHNFKDKEDLFRAVFDYVEREMAEKVAAAARAEAAPWKQFCRGCEAHLDACLDPGVRRIIMLDGPAVLGWEAWRRMDGRYGWRLVGAGLEAAMRAGDVDPEPAEPLAHLLLGALNEAAMVIAHADNPEAARREVGAAVSRLLRRLRSKKDRRVLSAASATRASSRARSTAAAT